MKTDETSNYRVRMYKSYRSVHASSISADDRAARAPYLRHVISKHFPLDREAKILDLGCGSGTILHFLREGGYRHIFGVDASPAQITTAQQLHIDGVQKGDLLDILHDYDNESLDVVIAFDVIEHMTKPELLEVVDQVYRVLKSGGRWFIHMPNAGALFGSRVRYADWTHEQAFTRESIEQLLHALGFAQIRCYEDQPIIHGLASALRWMVWKVARGVLRIYWMAETGSTGKDCIFSQNFLAIAVKRD